MPIDDAVSNVVSAERFEHRDQRFEIVEAVDDGRQRLHQLAALLGHVGIAEQRLQRGIERKQPVIEQGGRDIGDRNHHRPSGFYECLVFG